MRAVDRKGGDRREFTDYRVRETTLLKGGGGIAGGGGWCLK